MRIIAGRHRGRKLIAPADARIRPTSDRAREALFDILEHRAPGLHGKHFVDLCAGTGAVGLEAYSRGAAEVLLVENDPAALDLIRRNRTLLGDPPEVQVLAADAVRLQHPARRFEIAFLDPPYGSGLAGPILEQLERGWLAPDATVVVELQAKEPFTPPPAYTAERERRYGAARLVCLTFLLRGSGAACLSRCC